MRNLFTQRHAPTANSVERLPDSGDATQQVCAEQTIAFQGGYSRCCFGFTLVELMVTLTVAVILVIVAVPSFKSIIYSNKLTSASNDMVAALNSARLEAVKRNATVQFCSDSAANNTTDTLGTACGTQQAGAVYLWPASTSSAIQVLAGVGGIVSPLQLSGTVKALRFNGQGLAQDVAGSGLFVGTVSDICTASISSNNHRVVSMVAGSIISTQTTTAACP